MHELGYCEALLDAVEQRADGRPVSRVRVRIGARHQIISEALQTAFDMVAAGSVADGAAVDLVTTPLQMACADCGHRTATTDPVPACPECGRAHLEVSGGDEVVLEAIELRPG